MKQHIFGILVIFLSLISVCLNWGYYGHFVVTQIAENELAAKNPNLLESIKLISGCINSLVDYRERTFIEASAWPDGLKYEAFTFLNDWHFIDQIIKPENPPPEPPLESTRTNSIEVNQNSYEEEADLFESSNNGDVIYGLEQCKKVITKCRLKQNFANAMMTRYLIHLVGDAHQPLHCSTLVNSEFPYGDLGGNKFNITYNGKTGELHQFWDWGLWRWEYLHRPLTDEGFSQIQKEASSLTTQYPRSFFGDDMINKEPKDWVKESWEYAWKYSYQPLLNSAQEHIITDDYVAQGGKIADQRIAIAGYRLADTLIKYFSEAYQESLLETEE